MMAEGATLQLRLLYSNEIAMRATEHDGDRADLWPRSEYYRVGCMYGVVMMMSSSCRPIRLTCMVCSLSHISRLLPKTRPQSGKANGN